jgi:hypothetical protein
MADNETTPQPLIEQTSSSENHYELMAIARGMWEWFGLNREKPYLEQMAEDLHEIRVLMEQSWATSEQMRLEAQRILDAHAQSAQEYIRQIEEPVPVDYHPFESMPVGTSVRDLPDGGRLFSFSDGAFLRVFPDGQMSVIDESGTPVPIGGAVGGKIMLPDGRELSLIPDALRVTHEAAGIEGLPDGVEPVLASPGRYTVVLPDGTRLDVYQSERAVAVANPSGTIDVLGISRTYGIGEDVQARSVSGGAKSFRAAESGHAGMIEADATIHLSMSSGLALIIRFPDGPGSGGDDSAGPACFNCVEPE